MMTPCKRQLGRRGMWAFLPLFVLMYYVAYSGFTSFSGSRRPFGRPHIDQEACTSDSQPLHLGETPAKPPWWESDDCQCESQECGNPSVTFRRVFNGVGGTCGFRAWAAGAGQRVLSYCLYGNNTKYWKDLGQIFHKVEQLYPGWKVRLYTNPRGREAVLCPLLHRHPSLLFVCDITSIPPPLGDLSNLHPMIWRVAPLGDPQVAAMVSRDTDSQVSEREVAAVQEWLTSGKAFHVMRDHPLHTMPVMGGMWGARWDENPAENGRKMRLLRHFIFSLCVGMRVYGFDQRVLQGVLWPAMAGRVVAHDSYNCQRFKGSSPFPTRRKNKKFVGASSRNNASVPRPCPEVCRPPAHRDWLYC